MSEDYGLTFTTLTECVLYLKPWIAKEIQLEKDVCNHVEQVKSYKSGVFGSKKSLKIELDNYFTFTHQASDLRNFIRALQEYILIKVHVGSDEAKTLLDIIEQTDKKLGIYFELINRKSSEISSARLSLTNIILSIVAVIVAVASICA